MLPARPTELEPTHGSLSQTSSPWGTRLLGILALLFFGLGLGYGLLTPLFENSDETLHYPYVKHLADGQGLPVATPGQLWNQEGTQPPLYYAIVAASTFWLETNNLPELLQRNPHWLFAEVRALINDNQNLVLHGPMDSWPYHRAALAVYLGRSWSLAFGLVTVICTYLIAQQLFPNNLPLILTATALTAFTPQFIRVSATVSNDSLSAALASLTVLLALKFTTPSYQPTNQLTNQLTIQPPNRLIRPLLLGLLCGLAILTKLSSLSVLTLVAFIIFWRLFFLSELHDAPFQTMLRWLTVVVVTTLALTGWWFFRNYQLYGEWFATETHLNLAGRSPLSLVGVWELRLEAARAYWATFGWGQIRPPEWVFQGLIWFSRVGLLGLGLSLLAKLGQGHKTRPLPLNLGEIQFDPIIILLLWAALNVILYLRWVMEVGSVSHTRLVFPAIAAISLLLALGWHSLIPRRWAAGLTGLVTLLLLALNLYSLGWLIYPAFRPTGDQTPVAPVQAAGPNELDLTFLNSLKLLRAEVYPKDKEQDTPISAKSELKAGQGDTIIVKAMWQTLAAMSQNYSLAVVLLAPDGTVLSRRESYPGLGLRPTRYLQPGDSFVDLYPLKLAATVPEPLVARAVISLFDVESADRAGFPALDAAGREVTPIAGQIKIVPSTWPAYSPEHAVGVNFANSIELIGYDLTPPLEGGAGGGKILTLYWRSLAPVADDYVLFVHLLDAAANLLAQADAPPTNNAYPTSWWAPGEIIADRRALPHVPAAGAIRLGLYKLNSGQRLPILESTLSHRDDSVEIALP